MPSDLVRVSRRNPCPACGRADWCLVAPNGATAICQRVESARRCGEAGWLHREDAKAGPARRRSQVRSVMLATAPSWIADFLTSCRAPHGDPGFAMLKLAALSVALRVPLPALDALGGGWSMRHDAFAFPMFDGYGDLVGVHLRWLDGRKQALAGSKLGLFIPQSLKGDADPLLICEGLSDTAAALSLGFRSAVGRPSCSAGGSDLVALCRRLRPASAVIVADADTVGQAGARRLAADLHLQVLDVRVITPPQPFKDFRGWTNAGADRAAVQAALEAAVSVSARFVVRRMRRAC